MCRNIVVNIFMVTTACAVYYTTTYVFVCVNVFLCVLEKERERARKKRVHPANLDARIMGAEE